MIAIIPAVLPKSFDELKERLARLCGVAPLVQIDLVGTNILAGHDALPFGEAFDFECDLMLGDPAAEVQTCIDIGASRVIVHAEDQNAHEALLMLQQARADTDFPIAVGVALRAHDTAEVLDSFAGLYDFVQVMGIDHIG